MKRKIIAAMTAILMGLTFAPTLKQVKADTDVQPSVSYTTHVQRIGWQNYVSNGSKAGTEGKGLRLEGIKIKVTGDSNLGISYSTHVQKIGWQNSVSDNALSGTEGKALRLEGIKINLTGADKDKYDIYYRVHVQKIGWQGWVKNGDMAGTEGKALRLEGIQIKIAKRNAVAPVNDTSTAEIKEQSPEVTTKTYRGTTSDTMTGETVGATITEVKTTYSNDHYVIDKTIVSDIYDDNAGSMRHSVIKQKIDKKGIQTNTTGSTEFIIDSVYEEKVTEQPEDSNEKKEQKPPTIVHIGDQIIDGKIVHAK